jgi:F0F1-type ATP synthase assembly protein I
VDDEKFRTDLAALKKQETEARKKIKLRSDMESNAPAADNSRAMRYTWLGAEFAGIFFVFAWGGLKLDTLLGTKPWLVLVGISAGFALALYRLIFVARQLSE